MNLREIHHELRLIQHRLAGEVVQRNYNDHVAKQIPRLHELWENLNDVNDELETLLENKEEQCRKQPNDAS